MRPLCTFLSVAAALAAAPAAHAACALNIEPTLSRWALRADPFAAEPAEGRFEIAYVNNGDQPCEADVLLRVEGEPYGLKAAVPHRIDYAVIDNINGADITPRAGRSVRTLRGQTIRVEPGERLIRRYTFIVNPGPVAGDGSFEQTVFVDTQGRDGRPIAQKAVTLALEVTPAALIGLKGAFQRTQSGARIDLGDLTTGPKNLPVQVYVQSTRGYRITVSSQNGGQLRLAHGAWAVPYGLALGSTVVNLRGVGGSVEVSSAGVHNDSYPLAVVIGDVSARRAGVYSDLLTLTVAPL